TDVAHKNIESSSRGEVERGAEVASRMNLVTPTAQHSGQRMIRVLVVLDQEETHRTARRCCARRLGGFRDRVSFACRKERGEFGASIASITFGVDKAAMRFNQRFADGETESKPT